MKLRFFCPICADEIPSSERTITWIQTGLVDTNVYSLACSVGHYLIVSVQGPKFQTLFQVAINDIADGYYREAVLSFNGSLERFYEYYLEVITTKNNVIEQEYEAYRKVVAKQSERELGAFFGAYMSENRSAPAYVGDVKFATKPQVQFAAFRNRVVHQGYIPDENEAILFGDAMLNYAQPLLSDMKRRYSEAMRQVSFKQGRCRRISAEKLMKVAPKAKFVRMAVGCGFSPDVGLEAPLRDVQAEVAEVRASRQRYGSSL